MKNPIYYFYLFLLIFTSCLGQNSDKFKSLTAKDFSVVLSKDQNPQLLDVRSPAEFSESHLQKAINLNLNGDNFEAEAQKMDKTKPVYVYCHAGGRSKKAAAKLHELGFENILELNGGISDWKSNQLPTQK